MWWQISLDCHLQAHHHVWKKLGRHFKPLGKMFACWLNKRAASRFFHFFHFWIWSTCWAIWATFSSPEKWFHVFSFIQMKHKFEIEHSPARINDVPDSHMKVGKPLWFQQWKWNSCDSCNNIVFLSQKIFLAIDKKQSESHLLEQHHSKIPHKRVMGKFGQTLTFDSP